jgi:2'-5' RNA ligase
MNSPEQSAILIPVPACEPLVSGFRRRYDPAAADGIPAHITLIYPFAAPADLDAALIEELRTVFDPTAPFTFELVELRQFPETLYLAPSPDEPFRRLTSRLVEHFPEYPPYRGQFKDVIPHLTVGYQMAGPAFEALQREVAAHLTPHFPLRATATEALLMGGRLGSGWSLIERFEFGATVASSVCIL